MKKAQILGAFILTLSSVPAYAFDWNNNQISYWYGSEFKEPGVSNGGDVAKNIVTLMHADGYSLGQNLIVVDILKSNSSDPASNASEGATEIYVVDRQDFSLNKISNSSVYSFGPIRDVTINAGFDLNTKNTSFDSYKRMPVAGLAGFMDVPGFWKIAILWEKEWNQNGITHENVTFNSVARLESAWEIPFAVRNTHFFFEGYGNYNGPKGVDGFGNKTKEELLIHAQVMLDVGAWIDHPRLLKIGAGYQYWLNKFGDDSALTQGAIETAPFIRLESAFSF